MKPEFTLLLVALALNTGASLFLSRKFATGERIRMALAGAIFILVVYFLLEAFA
jgi:hypothetical protein